MQQKDILILSAILVGMLLGYLILGSWIWLLLAIVLICAYLYLNHSNQQVAVQLLQPNIVEEEQAEEKTKPPEPPLTPSPPPKPSKPQKKSPSVPGLFDEVLRRVNFPSVGMIGPSAEARNAFVMANAKRMPRRKSAGNERV